MTRAIVSVCTIISFFFLNSLFSLGNYLSVSKSAFTLVILFFLGSLFISTGIAALRFKIAYDTVFKFSLLVFSLCVLWPLFRSIVVNEPIEYLPSFLRYSSYFLFFVVAYSLAKFGYLTLASLDVLVLLVLVTLFVFGMKQVANDDLVFMNSAYRLSSLYGANPAGLALSALAISIYCFTRMVSEGGLIKIYWLLATLVAFYLMYATHSRQAIVTFMLVAFLVLFVKYGLWGKLVILAMAIQSFSLFIWLVFTTDFFPRFTLTFTQAGLDSSTGKRLEIIYTSISHLTISDWFLGIGLGGFNIYWAGITGELGVAAHNDYLLFFVEGGVFSFLMYVFFIVIAVMVLFTRSIGDFRYALSFSVFLAIPVMSFLNNPYYYPQTMGLVMLILGVVLGGIRRNDVYISK